MRKNTESSKSKLGALKAEMAAPRLAASVRQQSVTADERTIDLTGSGQMRPALRPHIQFRVIYAMKFMKQGPDRSVNTPAELASGCTECSIEPLNQHFIPDGDYLLHFDNDGVHHVRKNDGLWIYLAIPLKSTLKSKLASS